MSQGSILAQARAAAAAASAETRESITLERERHTHNGVAHAAPVPPVQVQAPSNAAADLLRTLQSIQQQAIAGAGDSIEARAVAAAERAVERATGPIIAELEARLATLKASVDPAELRNAARAALVEEIVDPLTRASQLAAGQTELHPPVLQPDPCYVQTETGRDIEASILEARTFVLVSGPSGSGKTFPIEQELRKAGRRYLKVSCADGVSRGELVGRMEAANGATRWVDGAAVRCARHGYALVLDEIGKLDSLVLASVQALLDRNPSIVTPWGEHVQPAPGFQVFATCNALTDETGLYVEQAMSADLPNRAAGALILADYLTSTEEEAILVQSVPALSSAGASGIVADLGALRTLYRSGQLQAAPSLRVGLAVAECVTGSRGAAPRPFAKAWKLALLDGLKPSDAVRAQSHLGTFTRPADVKVSSATLAQQARARDEKANEVQS